MSRSWRVKFKMADTFIYQNSLLTKNFEYLSYFGTQLPDVTVTDFSTHIGAGN